MINLLGIITKGIERLASFFNDITKSNKIVKFKDENVNKELSKVIINGDVNAPLNVTIAVQGDKVAFAGNSSDLIKRVLSEPEKGELIQTDFALEYEDYNKKEKSISYKHKFLNGLDPKYKALVKASEYIKELYNKGDMDCNIFEIVFNKVADSFY